MWISYVILLSSAITAITSQGGASEDETIVFADGVNVVISDVTLHGLKYLVSGKHDISNLDFDIVTETFYWINKITRTIQRAQTNGTVKPSDVIVEDFLDLSGSYPDSLAVDWHNRKLYWTDSSTYHIKRIGLDGSNIEDIVYVGDLRPPHSIIVNPSDDKLYWIVKGISVVVNGETITHEPIIEKSNLDGSGRATIISTELGEPTALSWDHNDQAIYWADQKYHQIVKCNKWGWDRQTVVSDKTMYEGKQVVTHTGGIAVSKQFIYWTETNSKTIYRRLKYISGTDTTTPTAFSNNLVQPTSIHVYAQPINKCSLGGGCDAQVHECTDQPTGPYLCSCPVGTTFNNGTCTDIDECILGLDDCMNECVNTIGSYRCNCSHGYTLTNNTDCTDNDECDVSAVGNLTCQQTCINTAGSYQCGCKTGHVLNTDGKTCGKVTCMNPPLQFTGVNWSCDPVPYYPGHVCRFFCDNRGQLYGSTNMTCDPRGQWALPRVQPYCYSIPIEPPMVIDWSLVSIRITSNNVLEGTSPGSHIGILRLSVPSLYSHIAVGKAVFSLVTTNVPFMVTLNTDIQYVTVTGILDYETTKLYKLNISAKVTDVYNNIQQISSVITIDIVNKNEPPSKPSVTRTSVKETKKNGGVVALFNSTDPDYSVHDPTQHQHLEYKLLKAVDSNGNNVDIFEVADDHGILLRGSLDYETIPYYILTIKVQDTGIPVLSSIGDIRINVTDVNEGPTDIILSNNIINEIPDENHHNEMSLRVAPVIGMLTTVDEDINDQHTYKIIKDQFMDDIVECFQIGTQTDPHSEKTSAVLKVYHPVCFDYEFSQLREVTIRSTDHNGLYYQKVFTIQITDVNDPPTKISFTGTDIMEHSPNGMTVGMLFVSDPDQDDYPTLTLMSSTKNWLKLKDNLKVVVNGDIDYELSHYIKLEVKAVDKGGQAIYANFTVNVGNKVEGPVVTYEIVSQYQCTANHTSICLNETVGPDTVVASVKSAVANTSIWIRDRTGSFVLKQGEIRTSNKKLDYESGARNIVIRVTAMGQYGTMSQIYINIKVFDVNEPPTDVLMDNTIIPSNANVDTTVGLMTCLDDHSTGDYTFMLVSNPGDVFMIQGRYLMVAKPITELEYTISVKCSDGKSWSPVKTIVIEHSSTAGKDIVITLDNRKVLENAVNGSVIGTISVTSSRNVDMFSISIENAVWYPYSVVPVSSTTANLVVTKELNYETEPYLDITIKATSQITRATAFKTIEIEVLNVPESIILSTNRFLETKRGNVVAKLSVGDPGINGSYTFTIDTPLPLQVTNSTPTTAVLSNTKTLNYENKKMGLGQKFKLNVTVTDNVIKNVTLTKVFTVKIVNVNEAPRNISLSKNFVLENTPPGTVVSQLVISDPDAVATNQTYICDFIRNDHGWFRFNRNLSITVDSMAEIDYEANFFKNSGPRHVDHLVFECWDQGGLSVMSDVLEIEIKDVNDKPHAIRISRRPLTINENSPAGTEIAKVTVRDADVNDTFTLQLLPRGNDSWIPPDLFYIKGDRIVTNGSLNYEDRYEYKIKIIATDNGGLKKTRKFRITVINQNDAPTAVFVPEDVSILEHPKKGAFITYLYTMDEDHDQGHSYSIVSQDLTGAVEIADNNKLIVVDSDILDYERYHNLSLVISSTDRGTPPLSVTQEIVIEIKNLIEPPNRIVVTPATVREGANNDTIIGNVVFYVNTDKVSVIPSYVYLSHDADGRFKVIYDQTNYKVVVADGGDRLNYEEKDVYNITIFCMIYGAVVTETVEISLLDADDPPIGLIFQAATDRGVPSSDVNVMENIETWNKQREDPVIHVKETVYTPNVGVITKRTIAYMYVLDEDMTHTEVDVMSLYQFEISDHPDEVSPRSKREVTPPFPSLSINDFSIEPVPGSQWLAIKIDSTLDFEARSNYTLYFIVKLKKADPPETLVQPLQIIVENIEESAYSVVLNPSTIAENNKPHTKIGTIKVLYQDLTAKHPTQTVSVRGRVFYLSGRNLYSTRKFNYEIQSMYTIPVYVSESVNGVFVREAFKIQLTISDLSEPPCCLTVDGTKDVPITTEAVNNGAKIGTLTVKDEDLSDKGFHFNFTIVSVKSSSDGDETNYFSIASDNKLMIGAGNNKNITSNRKYKLKIRTVDSTGLGYTGTVNVNVVAGCGLLVCDTNAICNTRLTKPFCECKAGYSGTGSSCTLLDPCKLNPCRNHGNCYVGSSGNYLCQCTKQFTGLNCEVDKSYCDHVTCAYGGVCVPAVNGYTCECDDPYKKDCSGCINPNDKVCHDNTGLQKSDKSSVDRYLPAVIALPVAVVLLLVVVIVVCMMKRQRYKTVNRRIRFNSLTGSVNVQDDIDYKPNTDTNQFHNPLYDSVTFRNNNVVIGAPGAQGAVGTDPEYSKKVPLDMCDTDTVKLEKQSELTRTMSQQDEVTYNNGGESNT